VVDEPAPQLTVGGGLGVDEPRARLDDQRGARLEVGRVPALDLDLKNGALLQRARRVRRVDDLAVDVLERERAVATAHEPRLERFAERHDRTVSSPVAFCTGATTTSIGLRWESFSDETVCTCSPCSGGSWLQPETTPMHPATRTARKEFCEREIEGITGTLLVKTSEDGRRPESSSPDRSV
jgi:hypothetical protein